jgi:hypothetical protein
MACFLLVERLCWYFLSLSQVEIWFDEAQLHKNTNPNMQILYNFLSAFWCAWLWDKASIKGQLFTFNSHKTSHVEPFVLHNDILIKIHFPIKLEEGFTHLNMQTLKNLLLASYEHTQMMIAPPKENILYVINWINLPWKKNHFIIQALTICSQPTYITNLKRKNIGVHTGKWLSWPFFVQYSIKKILKLHSSSICFKLQNKTGN